MNLWVNFGLKFTLFYKGKMAKISPFPYHYCYYFHLARHNLMIYQPPPTQLAKRSRRQCSTSLIGRQNNFIEQISRRWTYKFCEVFGINPYKHFPDLVVVFLSTVAFAINLSNISFLAFQRNFLTYLQVWSVSRKHPPFSNEN